MIQMFCDQILQTTQAPMTEKNRNDYILFKNLI
jgi:hypothetical protein